MSKEIIDHTAQSMKKAIAHFEGELLKIRAGKASPQMLDGIMVDYYGNPTPINQVANVSSIDARTLTIQAFEKNLISDIERAIMAANIGVTPQNDGILIKIFMPPLTEERRKEMTKKVHHEGENGKIAIRNIRRDAMEDIKKLQKDGLSEDEAKGLEAQIQALTTKHSDLIEKHCEVKEKELMTV
jgi:ribosome recycling factor